MIMTLAQGVVVNLFVVLGFVALYALAAHETHRRQQKVPTWSQGLLFGVMAVVSMLVPVVLSPGVLFDCRTGVIGAAALLGGPLTALACLPLPCAYRLYIGGGGTIPGLLELLLPALFGSLCYLWFHRRRKRLTFRRIVGASLAVAVGTDVSIFTLVRICMPGTNSAIGAGAVFLVFCMTVVTMTLLSELVILEREYAVAVESVAESERRMLHSQKMAALGQLSGKVAHDLLNALTTVLGNAQLAKDISADSSTIAPLMDGIIETAARTSRLTGELLGFSRPHILKSQKMDLSGCLSGIEQILAKSLGPQVEMVIHADPRAGKVNMDPDLMQQALLHMAINGAEAMSGKGQLTIRVSPANLSESERRQLQGGIHDEDHHVGDFALLSVEDTGCGMTQETVLRIFEPFFTTKKQKSAGLGLASVYNIVRQHDGFIDVQSRPGHGSIFMVYLPVVA